MKTVANHLTQINKITEKNNTKVQLEMFMFDKTKCLCCASDTDFEKN